MNNVSKVLRKSPKGNVSNINFLWNGAKDCSIPQKFLIVVERDGKKTSKEFTVSPDNLNNVFFHWAKSKRCANKWFWYNAPFLCHDDIKKHTIRNVEYTMNGGYISSIDLLAQLLIRIDDEETIRSLGYKDFKMEA